MQRWTTLSPEADDRQEAAFDAWLEADGIPFENEESEAAYKQRVSLIRDAVQLRRVPQRIPMCPMPGHFPIEYAGISMREAMYDDEQLALAWKQYHADFATDVYHSPRGIVPGKMLDILDFELYQWAGHGLTDDQEYQFVEKEYMPAGDYQDLIDDPTGYFLNVYFPKIFRSLKPLTDFPLLPPVHEIPLLLPAMTPFGSPAMASALQTLASAGEAAACWNAAMDRVTREIMAKGLPGFSGGFSKAPFDVIGDSLRGTRGIMTDMFRFKEELIEACERLTPFMVKCGIAACRAAGHPMPCLPLHKGADGFMSERQFETFYWPTLRKVAMGLIDAGLVPILCAEGSYNTRLEIIGDLPKGKVIWLFDQTDMQRAKASVGRQCCLAGNVPRRLLCTGRPEDVVDYCRNLIDTAGPGGGFILATGAGMQGAKAANIKAMIDFAREYGVYR